MAAPEDSGAGAVREWAVTLPNGSTVSVLDLPWDDVRAAAAAASTKTVEVPWYCAVLSPLAHPTLAAELYRAACASAAVKPIKGLTARAIHSLLNMVDADEPWPPEPLRVPDTETLSIAAPPGKQWSVTPAGSTEPVLLWDLSENDIAKLSDKLGIFWLDVVDRTLIGTGKVADGVVALAAALRGVDPPTGLSVREFIDQFDLVDDDKPTSFVDGFPIPKATAAEADQATP